MDIFADLKAGVHKEQHEYFKSHLTPATAMNALDFLNSRSDPGHEGYSQRLLVLIAGEDQPFGNDDKVTGDHVAWCLTKFYDVPEPHPMFGWGLGRGSSTRAMLQAITLKTGYIKNEERVSALIKRINRGLREHRERTQREHRERDQREHRAHQEAKLEEVTVIVKGVTDDASFMSAMTSAGFTPLRANRESNREYIFPGVLDKAAFLTALPSGMPSLLVTQDNGTAWLVPDTPMKRPRPLDPNAPPRDPVCKRKLK